MKKTLQEIADLTESRLVGDPNYNITHYADLDTANPSAISFFSQPKFDRQRYKNALQLTKAGALFVDEETPLIEGRNYLITSSPSLAFQKTIESFCQDSKLTSAFQGIHPTAIIHESCQIEEGVTIGPYAVVDQYVKIGQGTTIGPHCAIGHNSTIGAQCTLHAKVVIRERCTIGNRVIIQPGAVIGSCGFGYTTDEKGHHQHLKQLGIVSIEDDVDIGANTTIDRSRFKETRIKRGSKIDNLVQIGHGVEVGEDNIIVSQTGIAGSTSTGRHVVLGGQVAVNGHIKLGDGVIVTARTGVSKSLLKPGKYGGVPAVTLDDYNRNAVYLRNIEKYIKKINTLEKIVLKKEA